MPTFNRLVYVCVGIIFMASALFMSCAHQKTDITPLSPTQQINAVNSDVKNAATTLQNTTNTIKTDATEGMKQTPPAAAPVLNPHWTSIISQTGIQEQLVKDLQATSAKADQAQFQAKQFEQAYQDEHIARMKAEDNTTKELRQKYMAYSGVLFFAMLICGGLAIWSGGNQLFIYGGILCAAGSAAAIFVVQTVAMIPWIIGGILVILAGMLVYRFYTANKTEKVAVPELAKTVEAIKPGMTLQARKDFFGEGPKPGLVEHIQTPFTKKLVALARSKMPNKDKAPGVPVPVAVDYNGDGVIDEKDAQFVSKYFFRQQAASHSEQVPAVAASADVAGYSTSSAKKTFGGRRRKISGPVKGPIILN